MSNKSHKSSNHIFYLDALRAMAIIAVILSHVFNDMYGLVAKEFGSMSFDWIFTSFYYCLSYWGVALFLVISGALLLGRNEDIKTFFSKRMPRIVIPFVFWGFALSLFLVFLSYYNPSFIKVVDSFDVGSILTYIFNSFMAINFGFRPFWFFWMIFGLYLIMPFINKCIHHSNLREVEFFLVIWLIACFLKYDLLIEFPFDFTYFAGPIGFVVLGYYLMNTKRKLFNNPYFGLVLYLSVFLLSFILNFILSNGKHFCNIHSYSLIVIAEVFGIFIFAKNFDKLKLPISSDNIFGKVISSLALYSYGIYLIHRVVLVVLCKKYMYKFIPYPKLFCILFFGALFIPWGLLFVLNRIPYIKNVMGVT